MLFRGSGQCRTGWTSLPAEYNRRLSEKCPRLFSRSFFASVTDGGRRAEPDAVLLSFAEDLPTSFLVVHSEISMRKGKGELTPHFILDIRRNGLCRGERKAKRQRKSP